MIKIHIDGTSLEAPDGTEPVTAQAVDSPASTWNGGGFTIVADRGPFADRLSTAHEGTLGGIPVRLRAFEAADGTPVAVAHLPHTGTTVIIRGRPGSDPDAPLRMLRTLRPDAARDQGDAP